MTNRNATLVHFARGRIRLRVKWLKGRPRLLSTIREDFEALPAIRRVEFNQRTGSILLIYSPHAMEDGQAIERLLSALTTAFSPVHVGAVRVWRAGNSRLSLAIDNKIPSKLHSVIPDALNKFQGISDVCVDSATGKIQFSYDTNDLSRNIRLMHHNLRGNNWRALLRLFI